MRNVVLAELVKLRTLPAAVLTAAGTVAAGAAIAGALAAQDVPDVLRTTVPYVQAGPVLLGILPCAHEYAGRQIHTSLGAVPDRRLLLAGKTIAAIIALTVTAAAAVAAIAVTAAERPAPGAVARLALIGLLGHAVALLVRHLTPALVAVLGLVLIVSPLLAAVTEHARWLPGRAGAPVLLGWIAAVGAAGAVRFLRSDP